MTARLREAAGRARRWAAPLVCRVVGHALWYYAPDEAPDDLWYGCTRCRNPALVRDKLEVRPLAGHPDVVTVDPRALDRLRARVDTL